MRISQNQQGGTIIFDKEDWTNGLAPDYTDGTAAVRGGNRMSSSSGMNPFRNWGYPYPGYKSENATNNSLVTKFLRKGLVSGQTAYIVSNGADIHAYAVTTHTITSNGTFPHTIAPHGGHTTVVANDCVIYTSYVGGVSASRYFYSWSDNTDWDIGVYDFSTTFDDDFMSTAVATPLASPYLAGGVGFPHPLIVGDDDIMYVADRNFIHAFDGSVSSDGKFIPAVLTLPAGWIISSFTKVDNGLMIFAYLANPTFSVDASSRGQARAFLWYYNELDIAKSYDLHDNITSESFDFNGVPGVFTSGRNLDPQTNKSSKIQLFDGARFLPLVAFIGGIPIRGGVEIVGDSITWLAGDGGNNASIVYCYGSKVLGEKTGLNKIGSASGVETGMLATFYDGFKELSISSGTTSIGGLEYQRTGFSAGYLQTALAEPVFNVHQRGRVKCIKVEFLSVVTPSVASGMSLQLYNRYANQQILNLHDQVTTDSERFVIRFAGITPDAPFILMDGIAIMITWNSSPNATQAVIPASVTIEYENINI